MLKPLLKSLLLLSLVLSFPRLHSQVLTDFNAAEDSLKIISFKLGQCNNDSTRIVLNGKFSRLLRATLLQGPSFTYPFDSLRALGKLTSPDQKFRFYLWNIRSNTGQYTSYGFIQQPGESSPVVTPLTDRSDSITDPENQLLSPENWFGAMYYKIIPVISTDSSVFYTLLGWDGNNSRITQKVIEILSFTNDNKIQFGAPVFIKNHEDAKMRVIFRYSAEASMILKLDLRKEATMIICDHLVPLDPQVEGFYEHYVPDSEASDGFLLQKGKWKFVTGIDARNSR
jgi:hypothetical protein